MVTIDADGHVEKLHARGSISALVPGTASRYFLKSSS